MTRKIKDKKLEYQDSTRQGTLRELLAIKFFMEQGYIVSVPNMAVRYDFIAEKNRNFTRVQVKNLKMTKSNIDDPTSHVKWTIRSYSVAYGKKRTYDENDCDLVVGVCLETNDIAIVPISEIKGKTEFCLSEDENSNGKGYFIPAKSTEECAKKILERCTKRHFPCVCALDPINVAVNIAERKENSRKNAKKYLEVYSITNLKDKILGGIFGLCVADALGVPVEFNSRVSLKRNPVTDMRGYGIHNQPPGTWSDDTSMTLCLLDSLANGLDYADIMQKFLLWIKKAEYTPHGKVFDVGITTRNALSRFANGTEPLECGGTTEYDNGNGALMRILPLGFYLRSLYGDDVAENSEAFEIIHDVCSLTHAHKRSQIACGIYLSIAENLLDSDDLKNGVYSGIDNAKKYYANENEYADELDYYKRLFDDDFVNTAETNIKSSGYVVDTLEAAIWCLLNTNSYESCVLKAVNLGEDTDTVAAVAGGVAGIYYGFDAIPQKWVEQIARFDYIKELCGKFYTRELS